MANVKVVVINPHSQDVDVFEKVHQQEHGIGAAIAEKLAGDGAAVAVNFSSSAREADTVVANIQKREAVLWPFAVM